MKYLIVILLTLILTGCNEKNSVPLPTEKDVIRTFFSLINEKRIPEAIGMMDKSVVFDDSAKQAYGVQFNNFGTVTIKSIDQTSESNKYKVVFDTDSGEDTRWITVVKIDNLWKISDIATGP